MIMLFKKYFFPIVHQSKSSPERKAENRRDKDDVNRSFDSLDEIDRDYHRETRFVQHFVVFNELSFQYYMIS